LRTGTDLGAAREKVRAARALEELPETSASMARGELSFSQVRALTRVATPDNEGDLLELARGSSTAQLERIVRSWKRWSRKDEAELERELHRSRSFSVFPDEEGMVLVKGRLEPEVAALLMRAVEAASDALYSKEPGEGSPDREADPARRRADALALIAERALAAGFGGGVEAEGGNEGGAESEGAAVPVSGTRAERYLVMLHVEPDTLSEDREPGRSELEDGTRVSAETSRRLSCDASVVKVTHGPGGEGFADATVPAGGAVAVGGAFPARGAVPAGGTVPAGGKVPAGSEVLDVGRKTRTIPPALRRALESRDRGCRFPGCGLRFTDAHHVRHWADGGKTSLANCILLCRFHHRLVHEGGWRVAYNGNGIAHFYDPHGFVRYDARRPDVRLAHDPVAAMIADNREGGADRVTPWSASARWERESDIPDPVLFRAIEAVLPE
jgi:hypothetical protein